MGKDTGKEAVVEPEVIYKEEIVEKFVDKIIEVIFYLPHKLSCKFHILCTPSISHDKDLTHSLFVPPTFSLQVPVEKQVIKEVEREVFVERQIERIVEVPVQVERIVEVEVPYEKIVYVQKEVYRDVYKDVPVPVQMSNERVVIKEVLLPV